MATGCYEIAGLGANRVTVPHALPAPSWQGLHCTFGGNVVIGTRDGRHVEYGPCRRPESIDQLLDHLIAVYEKRQAAKINR